MVKTANFGKISIGTLPKTPGEMQMYDVVKIDAIVFDIVRGGGL